MVSAPSNDFAVTWDNPADAELTWFNDSMHQPNAVCQLLGEAWDGVMGRYMGMRTRFVNGYGYSSAPTPPPPAPEILERGVSDVWSNDYLPRIAETCAKMRSANYDALSLPEAGDAMARAMRESITAFGYTMKPITGFMGPTFAFVDFLQSRLGPEAPQLAAAMLQGFENGSAAAGAGLSALAEDAAARPAVAEALRGGTFDALESVDGGAEFMAKFRKYLDEFGWRVDSWGYLDRPTWAENPRLPLTLIGHYIADPERSPAAAHRRAVEQREAAVRDAESRLNPEALPQFREMLSTCQVHVPVSEGRALWQLIIIGSLRVPALALGRKLVAAAALERPEQAFLFTTSELNEAAHHPAPHFKAVAAKREADLARWRTMTPPPFIGAPPDPAAIPPEAAPMLTLFFGLQMPEIKGGEIKGQAASQGSAKGVARVITDLGDAERLQSGEILVCKMTAPPWTPLFAIAAAVVTDTGGVLSHSAICAREYAIPCVVATQVATQMIKDGSTITVDGTKGVVQIDA